MIKPYYHNSHFSFLFIYQAPIHRYAMRVLYLAYHNDTVQTAYTVYITTVPLKWTNRSLN